MAKPKLYIIHGWTYTTAPWERTIATLEKQGLAVEMLHVPGLTASSQKVWTIEEYTRWADRNIPDGSVALGHSNGGRILMNLCAEKPEKLKHLILLDSAGIYEVSSKRDVARSLSKKFGFLKKIPGVEKLWHKFTGASDYARAPKNMKQTLSNMLESDKKLDISKVKVPTSILWGEEDKVTPVHQAEQIHEQIKGSTLEIFPNWSHAPYLSHPLELAKAILKTYKNPPEKYVEPEEITDAAEGSAALALKKVEHPADTTADKSATLVFKKAHGPKATDAAGASAALAVQSKKQKDKKIKEEKAKQEEVKKAIIEELEAVDYEKTEVQDTAFETISPVKQMITTASVPKVTRKEKRQRAKSAKQTKRTKK